MKIKITKQGKGYLKMTGSAVFASVVSYAAFAAVDFIATKAREAYEKSKEQKEAERIINEKGEAAPTDSSVACKREDESLYAESADVIYEYESASDIARTFTSFYAAHKSGKYGMFIPIKSLSDIANDPYQNDVYKTVKATVEDLICMFNDTPDETLKNLGWKTVKEVHKYSNGLVISTKRDVPAYDHFDLEGNEYFVSLEEIKHRVFPRLADTFDKKEAAKIVSMFTCTLRNKFLLITDADLIERHSNDKTQHGGDIMESLKKDIESAVNSCTNVKKVSELYDDEEGKVPAAVINQTEKKDDEENE